MRVGLGGAPTGSDVCNSRHVRVLCSSYSLVYSVIMIYYHVDTKTVSLVHIHSSTLVKYSQLVTNTTYIDIRAVLCTWIL